MKEHGPAIVDDGTFIGMQALVFKAQVGKNVVVELGAILWNGVKIADGRYVPAGMVVGKNNCKREGERSPSNFSFFHTFFTNPFIKAWISLCYLIII
ncbi:MAG: hypothetical protein OIN86_15960 [Candidatus Methanoperedens sp.]|nr:hypothetical protein [Candidatus Methanoperedens sp.]CAG0985446.1 Carbon dioxide concentrating mechanism protein CcmM [Methanosarcinales archaeon]